MLINNLEEEKRTLVNNIREFAGLLNEYNLLTDSSPLYNLSYAIESSKIDRGVSYNLAGLEFQKISPRQFIKNNIWDNNLTLKLDLLVEFTPNGTYDFNGVKNLNVNIVYSCLHLITCEECHGSWHLDYHIHQPGDGATSFIHPLYHLQHGGKRLEGSNEFGNIVLLDAPRISHHPLDIFLAIDFVLTNFVEDIWRDLSVDNRYRELIKTAQEAWWKEYYKKISSFWDNNNSSTPNSRQICEQAKILLPHLC